MRETQHKGRHRQISFSNAIGFTIKAAAFPALSVWPRAFREVTAHLAKLAWSRQKSPLLTERSSSFAGLVICNTAASGRIRAARVSQAIDLLGWEHGAF
jgi:hypothetical protein